MLNRATRTWWIAGVLMIILAALLIGLSFFKFRHGLYNALDLAIFNQVFWQTTHGNLFGMTIHPHSYLGDHFDLFILFLAPFYAAISRPETLLVLQALAIASTPIPLLLLLKRILHTSNTAALLTLLGVILWVMNPYLHNAFFFEFHTLLFAAPLLTWSWWAYRTDRFWLYNLFLFLLLTLREDVSLTVGAFAFLAFLERRHWRWWAPHIFVASAWFFGAIEISSRLNTSGSYKFLSLYSWMMKGRVFMLEHLFTNASLRTLGLAISSFLFFPMLTPKALLLAIPSVAMIALSNSGLDTSFLATHYQIIFLTTLLIAFFDAIPHIVRGLEYIKAIHAGLQKFVVGILGLLFIIVGIQSSVSSPFFVQADLGTNTERLPQRSPEVRREFLEALKDADRILAGSGFLADLGQRETLMALHYVYIGKKQFSTEDFPLPSVDVALFDSDEILRLTVIKEQFDWARQGIHDGSRRLRDYLERENLKPDMIVDDTILFTKKGKLEPFSTRADEADKTAIGAAEMNICETRLCLLLETRHPAQGEDILIRIILTGANGGQVWQSFYLPAYGLFMPHEFEMSRSITTEWILALPSLLAGTYQARVTLETIEGEHAIAGLRQAAFLPKQEPTVLDERLLSIITIAEDGTVSEVASSPEGIGRLSETAEDDSSVR